MIVFLNGEFVPEERAVVSVFDRSFRYGDALFETMRVQNGKVFRWPQHFARLQCTRAFLKIPLPCSADEWLATAQELLRQNEMRDALLRIQLSRGTGPRGYAPTGGEKPFVVMSLHTLPVGETAPWKLIISSLRIPANDPLPGHKTANRLLQVLAAAEARERGADEALLLNTNGELTEGSASNVFWIEGDTVCTPPLDGGALPGVTRATVLELCRSHGISCAEKTIGPGELLNCEGVFLTLTSRGIVEAESVDGLPLRRSLITTQLRKEFEALLQRECA